MAWKLIFASLWSVEQENKSLVPGKHPEILRVI